jgi:hypothetical protein
MEASNTLVDWLRGMQKVAAGLFIGVKGEFTRGSGGEAQEHRW